MKKLLVLALASIFLIGCNSPTPQTLATCTADRLYPSSDTISKTVTIDGVGDAVSSYIVKSVWDISAYDTEGRLSLLAAISEEYDRNDSISSDRISYDVVINDNDTLTLTVFVKQPRIQNGSSFSTVKITDVFIDLTSVTRTIETLEATGYTCERSTTKEQ